MPINEPAISYEKSAILQKSVWKSEKELLRKISEINSNNKLRPQHYMLNNFLYLNEIKYFNNKKCDLFVVGENIPADDLRGYIPLHSLLKNGAKIIGFICFFSLLSWFIGNQQAMIVNPFAALLLLVASPFIYLMGRAAKHK